MCKTPDKTPPLLSVEVVRTGEACPFTNEKFAFELRQGEVAWYQNVAGATHSQAAPVLSRSVAAPGSPAPSGPLRGLSSPHIFNMPPQPSFAT